MKSNYNELKDELTKLVSEYEKDKSNKDILNTILSISKLMMELAFSKYLTKRDYTAAFIIEAKRKLDIHLKAPMAVTATTSGIYLLINPVTFSKFDYNEVMSIITHELYHLVNMHIVRHKMLTKQFEHTLVNIAMDCAINQFITGLPKGCITIESLAEMANLDASDIKIKEPFEYYLSLLSNKNDEIQKNKKEMMKKLKDMYNKSSQSNSEDGNGDEDGESSQSMGGQQENDDAVDNSFGNKGNSENNTLNSGHSKWDEGELQDSIKGEMTKRLLKGIKGRSTKSDSYFDTVLEELLEEEKIDWERLLKRQVGRLKVPYKKTFLRRNRKMPDVLYMKGKLMDNKLSIGIIIDTSGSIGLDTLKLFVSELNAILSYTKSDITILSCDTEVRAVHKFKDKITPNNMKDLLKGGGGTYMSPAIKYFNDTYKGVPLDLCICLTDGYIENHLDNKPDKYKMLWVILDNVKNLCLDKSEWYGNAIHIDTK